MCSTTIDAPTNDVGCEPFGTGPLTLLICPAPDTDFTMPNAFDTVSDCVGPHFTHVTRVGGDVCVVSADHLQIDSSGLLASNTLPLVLAAHVLNIDGPIDVGSSLGRGVGIGAGAGYNCTQAPSNGTSGGGGAGGSSQGTGGFGGAGSGPVTGSAQGLPFAELHGGCAGGAGDNAQANSSGDAGPGGGLLYMIGKSQIVASLALVIKAGGSHGKGGRPGGDAGGGGGGAGGMIVFDTPQLMITRTGGSVCAAGGGGGGGGDLAAFQAAPSVGQAGLPGQDACLAIPAQGGAGPPNAGNGGNGNGVVTLGGITGSAAALAGYGGGGGGGAAGFVLLSGGATPLMLSGTTVVPPAQAL
jgi:hypothetical protein